MLCVRRQWRFEGLYRGLRKTRSAFPSDEAAMKLLYLALRNLGVHLEACYRMASGIPAVRHLLPGQTGSQYTTLMTNLQGSVSHS
jgi:hypothetical protein